MSNRFSRRLSALHFALAGVVAVTACTAILAAPKSQIPKSGDDLVAEALHREIYGQDDQRDALLKQARMTAPENKAALWHAGFVERNREWVTVDEVIELNESDLRLLRYEAKRAKTPDTAEGHLALADWCAKNGLEDRERAHLTRVVELETNHEQARRRLGFVRVGGEWVSRTEQLTERQRAALAAKNLRTWRPRLEQIRRGLLDRTPKRRDYADQQLKEINDPAAIPAVEAVLAVHNEALARKALEVLGRIQVHESSVSLARIAVFSQWSEIRTAAARSLQDRPFDHFVPTLISALQAPIRTQRELVEGRGGQLMYRHVFHREHSDHHEVAVLETNYRRLARPGGNGNDTVERIQEDVQNRATARDEQIQQRNREITDLNDRIIAALAISTRNDTLLSVAQWRQWWNDYNEVYVSEAKTVRETRQTEEVTVADQTNFVPVFGVTGGGGGYDCLAAGTLVWTDRGLRAIERIQIGDRVLSQDPETGRLDYKPVLGTTVRPASDLVRFSLGEEEISTSGGHLFWVSGDGWVKSRDLKGGARLHGVKGTSVISFVGTGTNAETYNLIVADYHTYFVGKSRVLSHDNTVRALTGSVVPGLKAD